MTWESIADILNATMLFAVPLMLVALGGMFSERSGVINIALEGIMIIGALMGCLFLSFINTGYAAVTQALKSGLRATPDAAPQALMDAALAAGKITQGNIDLYRFVDSMPQLAMLGTIVVSAVAGGLFSLLLAFASINLKADQTIGGTALNMLAPAFAIVLTWAVQGQGQTTILIPTWARILGNTDNFFGRVLFKSCYLTSPVAVALLIFSVIFLYKTRLGLRLRSCGEHPQAADSVGINVYKMRYTGVVISGILGGIGGLSFTLAAGSGFQSNVAGFGFLALAVMIFGNWKPISILFAALFFALFKVISAYSGSIPFLPDFEGVRASENIYLMLPYVVTIFAVAGLVGRVRGPAAAGKPYIKS